MHTRDENNQCPRCLIYDCHGHYDKILSRQPLFTHRFILSIAIEAYLSIRDHMLPWMINIKTFWDQKFWSYSLQLIYICGGWMVRQKEVQERVEETQR